ncbi:MAG: hypothetical protein ACC655_06320 [Rhodothermia bacterium]
MKVVVITEFRPQGSDSTVGQNIEVAEAGKVLDDLHQRGILQTIHLRKDRPGTVMLMECGTVEDAHQHISNLPGVINGTTEYYLIPLGSELPPNAFLGARMAGH